MKFTRKSFLMLLIYLLPLTLGIGAVTLTPVGDLVAQTVTAQNGDTQQDDVDPDTGEQQAENHNDENNVGDTDTDDTGADEGGEPADDSNEGNNQENDQTGD